MKFKKSIMALFICSIIVISSFPTVSAETEERSIIDQILIGIYKKSLSGMFAALVPWKTIRYQQPEAFDSDPRVMEIEYNGRSEIVIGVKNESSGEYYPLSEMKDRIDAINMLDGIDWEFEVEMPEEVPDGALDVKFDPPILVAGEDGDMATKMVIIADIPKDVVIPKELVLKVNISRYVTADNTYIAPKEYGGGYYPLKYILFFFFSLGPLGMFAYGPEYSGKRSWDGSVLVDVVIKVKRFHLPDIKTPDTIEIGPDEVANIPVEIENLGSHLDTFNFDIETDSNLMVTPFNSVTLEPGEKRTIYVGVSSADDIIDPGTLHPIEIKAYSIYDPENVFTNTVSVSTKGFYISEMYLYYLILLLIAIIVLLIIIWLYRRFRYGKICSKPDKPWDIPEEARHLQKLKEKNKAEHKKALLMMDEEYASSLLWYKHYCKAMIKKKKEPKQKIKQKEEKIKVKEKEIKKVEKEEHIPKIEEISGDIPEFKEIEEEIREEKPILISKEDESDKKRKKQAYLRIKQAQEKQKRKLGFSI